MLFTKIVITRNYPGRTHLLECSTAGGRVAVRTPPMITHYLYREVPSSDNNSGRDCVQDTLIYTPTNSCKTLRIHMKLIAIFHGNIPKLLRRLDANWGESRCHGGSGEFPPEFPPENSRAAGRALRRRAGAAVLVRFFNSRSNIPALPRPPYQSSLTAIFT